MRVRHITKSDFGAGGEVLARSFYDDPVMRYLYPDDISRAGDLAWMFEICLGAGMRRGTTYLLDAGGVAGVAQWSPPDVEASTREETAEIPARVIERYGDDGLARLRELGEVMGGHHPEASHFYLWIVGVDPDRQGQGLGAALLAPVLAQCDNDEMPAYLESSNRRNVAFYQRLGFAIREEFGPDGGPTLTGMWREPR